MRICLLRGVNVGGVTVRMADLVRLAAEAGCRDPRTLLASGNLVVTDEREPAALEAVLEERLAGWYGRRIDVVVRTPAAWRAMIAANPFPAHAEADPKHLVVLATRNRVPDDVVEALRGFAVGGEAVAATDDALWCWHPAGSARSKLAEKLQPKWIGVATGRNWNTVLKLRDLVAGHAG